MVEREPYSKTGRTHCLFISKFVRSEDIYSFRSYKFPYKSISTAYKLPYDAILRYENIKTGNKLALNYKLMSKKVICPSAINI